MNISRTIAITITSVSAILFGIPALGLTCFGTYMAFSTRIPSLTEESSSSRELMSVLGIFIALFGLSVLLLIVGVGIFSVRLSQPDQPVIDKSGESLPLP